ncbi:MAG: D-alanine--D-alanine ligase [Cyclobacteriaceae bacterium]|nr:MAG: D-alanine--D-alanine ligase [Cyclobacteriaceae bacterium]
MSAKKKVAILYGGRSVEHAVSVNSAKNIFEHLNRDLYEAVPIGISTSGQWYLTQTVSKDIEQGKALGLILDPKNPGFLLLSSGDRFKVDIVFPVLHGTHGEDGSIQGMLTAMDIPFAGTGVLGSAIAMNKIVAKRLLQQAGLPVGKFIGASYRHAENISFESIEKKLGLPFMIKPASLGSSVGINKVSGKRQFRKAVEEAFTYDTEILFEKFIPGREIECAILGNEPPEASWPGEIRIQGNYEFYTFDAKYVDKLAVNIIVPAELERKTRELIRKISIKAYEALYCRDYARVDLFLTKTGSVFINEINTIPGFTNSSMYPMMWNERGIDFTSLITRLIELAESRHAREKKLERNFSSNIIY